MAITTADVYSYRQTNQKLHDANFLRLDATAANTTTNTGQGIIETNLTILTLDPNIYTVEVAGTGATACSLLVSVNASCTASMGRYLLVEVASGFNLKIGSGTTSGDTCIIEILNDYTKAYNLAVLELTKYVAVSETDYGYWLSERTNRHLLAKALREMTLTAYDITNETGQVINQSQRYQELRYTLREMDNQFSSRVASAFVPPEDADVVFDMENIFDETKVGYNDVSEY